jgi:hypothetical protein
MQIEYSNVLKAIKTKKDVIIYHLLKQLGPSLSLCVYTEQGAAQTINTKQKAMAILHH